MSFVMQSKITIGKFVFDDRTNSVFIDNSWQKMGAEAQIALPYLRGALDAEIKADDIVKIELGYNGELQTEFEGYVERTSSEVPFIVYCKDEFRQLEKKAILPKGWAKITLKEVLQYLDSTINTDGLPDITLSPFRIRQGTTSVAGALKQLSNEYGLAIYFRGKQLIATLPYYEQVGAAKFRFYTNCIDHSLVFAKKEEMPLQIKAISILPDGSKKEVTVGETGGNSTTLHFYNLTETELKQQATEKLGLLNFEGFRGAFKSWGIPYTTHTMTAQLAHPQYPEKNGNYVINRVQVLFNDRDGYKRINYLGRKL